MSPRTLLMMRGAPDAYPFPTLPAPLRFAIPLAAVLIVFVVDSLSRAPVDDAGKFLLLGIAVLASAWFAGSGPALAATVLGAVLGAYDRGTAPSSEAFISLHLALFVVQGLLLTAIVSELRAARRASEEQARVAQMARREGEAANRMKDEFLGTVSHELRTPLNAVLGWVHLLRTGKLDRETSTRGLESIERNVRLQAQLTADLLDVSKALTGQLQVEAHPTALGAAARQAVAAIDSAAKAKGVLIEVGIPDAPAVVLGDETRLRQIAWHLLSNAIKFTSRGGTVSLSVETIGDEAHLIVRDSGSGIDPAFLPRVFDRFTQADSSVTRTAGGLGVGLSLVRELVERHGGVIEASNVETGPGALFTARFPLQPAELLGRTGRHIFPAAARPGATAPLEGVRVVILDRDAEGRELVRAMLQQRGAIVQTAASTAEALELLEGWRPDVLVRESGAPQNGFYALFGKVQTLEADRGGRIPALTLTIAAPTDAHLAQQIAQVQRDVPKPVDPATLTAEIARLSGRERRRAQR
jgi:signal transduction histidine kinase/CheY-like chemotaxis protein